jgi:hypothetical protein
MLGFALFIFLQAGGAVLPALIVIALVGGAIAIALRMSRKVKINGPGTPKAKPNEMNSQQRLILIVGIGVVLLVIPYLVLGRLDIFLLFFQILIGIVAYFVILISAKYGHVKTAIGIILVLLAGISLMSGKVIQNQIQNDYDWQRGVSQSEQTHQFGKAIMIEYLGWGAGAVGLVFLLAGLIQKRPDN